jgi:hypothetical protein
MDGMKSALDHALVAIWTFLVCFFMAAAIYRYLPARWQFEVETAFVVEMSVLLLCGTSALRFLAYMEYSQWIAVPVWVVSTIIIKTQQVEGIKTWWATSVVGVSGALFVILLGVPLLKWSPFRIKLKMPWHKKTHKAAKLAQQAQALNARLAQAQNQ